jgi:hypothetical protein
MATNTHPSSERLVPKVQPDCLVALLVLLLISCIASFPQMIMSAPSGSSPRSDILRFTSQRHLRQRILLSILSGRSIRVDAIRSDDVHVGLRDYEINLLRLVEKVTNGTTIEISVTGESSEEPN